MTVVNFDTENIAPQWSQQSEQTVLGVMLVSSEDQPLIFEQLTENDFYNPAHRQIFAIARESFIAGRQVDLISVELSLEKAGQLEGIGGTAYLAELTSQAVGDITYPIERVKELSRLRAFSDLMTRRLQQAREPGADVNKILMDAEQDVYSLLTGESSRNTATMAEVMMATVKHLDSIQGSKSGVTGIPSGLPYDEITGGWQKGEFYVIAARPGMGKTAFMLQNLKAAAQADYPCGVISMEMSSESLASRMLLAEAGLDSWKARTGRLSADEIRRMHEVAPRLYDLGIVFDDTTDMSPSMLRIKARMMKQRFNIQLLAVDYVQLMHSDNPSREQQIAEVSRTCKLLAKELDIPVLGLSQLSRKPDDRGGWNARPRLGDLRESGALEQDADAVIFLFRPEEYGLKVHQDDGQSTEGLVEVIIDKHRNGMTGSKKLFFRKETMTFEKIYRAPVPHPADAMPVWYDDN